jgi:phosphoribosyl 1,2-cyclic phosphodiesterase
MIRIHHTGSTGNLYQLGDLLIEAGVPIRRIKEALGYDLSGVSGCFASHGHSDHAAAVRDLIRLGVDCYMTAETAAHVGAAGHRAHIIEPGKQFRVGGWTILPFPLVHDAEGHVGFLMVGHGERIAYITDTHYCEYYFTGLTRLMIEANYDPDILAENVEAGRIDSAMAYRVMRNHMSIDTALEAIRANMNPALREIVLIHLSAANANPSEFKKRVEADTGVPTTIYQGNFA